MVVNVARNMPKDVRFEEKTYCGFRRVFCRALGLSVRILGMEPINICALQPSKNGFMEPFIKISSKQPKLLCGQSGWDVSLNGRILRRRSVIRDVTDLDDDEVDEGDMEGGDEDDDGMLQISKEGFGSLFGNGLPRTSSKMN